MEKDNPSGKWAVPVTEFTFTRQNLPHIQLPGSYYFTASNCFERMILSPSARDIVMGTILHHSSTKYTLDAAVVMPDHFHLLLRPLPKDGGDYSLPEIFHSIKSYTAKKILSSDPRKDSRSVVWQDENYDHIIRNDDDYREKLNYLIYNPVKAGLVLLPQDYKRLYCPLIGKH